MTILLVRHAHAGSRGSWVADDRLRPVSATGRAQAEGLVGLFAGRPLRRILSSPFLRCTQTVEPLADATGLTVEETDALAEGHADRAVELVAGLIAEEAALCTHGDVIPQVLRWVEDAGGEVDGEWRWPKGSTWILEPGDGDVVTARFVRPTTG